MQDLWQDHYQILSIIFLNKFKELNVNLDSIIKKCETCEIKYRYCDCVLEYTSIKDDLIEYKCFYCKKNYHRKFE